MVIRYDDYHNKISFSFCAVKLTFSIEFICPVAWLSVKSFAF